jgi:hypothetical protein
MMEVELMANFKSSFSFFLPKSLKGLIFAASEYQQK